MNDMLTEKYRPQKLDDCIGQDIIVKRLKRYVSSKNMPNLLFAGGPGTGKSTMALCLAKELYGTEWKIDFMELNASDERGIDVIRKKVKEYANVQSMGDVLFKIILLDEADALTKDAQSALRRTMEKYTSSVRFILTCNYSSKIIEPIESRCSVNRFKRISNENIILRCKYVCKNEGIKIEDDALEAIAFVSEGDLRRSLNILNAVDTNNVVKVCNIYDVVGIVEPIIVKDIIKKALAREFFGALIVVEKVILDGLSAVDILKVMMREVLEMNIDDKTKVDIVDRIGECDFRVSEGANELIQLKWLIASMVKLGSLNV